MEKIYLFYLNIIENLFLILIKIVPIIAVFGPIIAGLLVLFCGCYISRINNIFFIIGNMFLSLLSIFYLFINIAMNKLILCCFLYNWLKIDLLEIDISLYYDSLSITMLLLVAFISFLVHLYSIYYMKTDPYQVTFMAYLSIFTFFMFFLVVSDNFVMFFFGWEGVGLCSYLLINFWSDRVQANKAALKAMIINRFGDLILLIAIAMIFTCFGSLNFQYIFIMIELFKVNNTEMSYPFLFDFIALLLFFGSIAKSAQLGLHSWLPDAMEGPTPVSALIHAATMVTAGVFLLIRCSYLLECSWYVKPTIVFFGSLTCLFAGLVGSFQVDIKKIIAYSTMGQLGYMYIACGLSCYMEAFFHLWIHGFIKAMLFLSAGVIIHNLKDEQNIFHMGGLINFFPLLFIFMLFASISLMALPYLSGYFSKHIILELICYTKYFGYFGYLMGSLSAFFTAFYSLKLLLFIFLGPYNGSFGLLRYLSKYEYSFFSYVPLFILVIASIIFGSFFYSIFIDVGVDFFYYNIDVSFSNNHKIESENLSIFYKYFPLFRTIVGCFFAIIYFYFIYYYGNYFVFVFRIHSDMNRKFKKIIASIIKAKNFFFLLTHSFFSVIFFYPYESSLLRFFLFISSPFLYILFLFKLLLKIFYITVFYVFGGLFELLFYCYNSIFFYFYNFLFFVFFKKFNLFLYKSIRCKLFILVSLLDTIDSFYMLHVICLLIRYDFYKVILYLLIKWKGIIENIINILPNEMKFFLKLILFDFMDFLLYYTNPALKFNEYQFFLILSEIDEKKIDNYCFVNIVIFNNSIIKNIYNNLYIKINSLYFFLIQFFGKNMFFDKIINNFLSLSFFRLIWYVFFKTFDKGLFELFGPLGLSKLIYQLSLYFLNFQNGWLFDYICTMLLGIVILLSLSYLFIN